MGLAQEIRHLLLKELILEKRQKYSFIGILLYVVSTVFVCYLSFKIITDVQTWNALFWIILLFSSVSAVAKSFISEKPETQLYLYTITSPESIILSKLIYNAGMMIFLALLCFGIYSLFLGNVAVDIPLFTISIVLGGVGLSSLFTMISAIASKADNSSVLIAILGFPIILPFLITIIKLSTNAIVGAEWSESYQYLGVLALLNLIVVTLSYILFPYLWKE